MLRARSIVFILAGGLVAPRALAAELSGTGMVCSQDGMPCRYWMPPAYDQNKRYPLVLYLHGAGQSGSDNASQVDDWGRMPPAMLDPARRAKYAYFFVAPQAAAPEGDTRWVNWDWGRGSYDVGAVAESTSMKKALAIVATLRARYSVDPERIYVMGESMGGFGTWDALARHPDIFAAGVPADGGGSPQAAAKLRDVAIFAAHYARDGAVPASSDREMFRAVAAAGGRPTYIEVATEGHGVSDVFLGSDVFIEWLFAQRRGRASSVPPPFIRMTATAAGSAFDVSLATEIKDSGIKLRYALDGTVPTSTTGKPYEGPIRVASGSAIHAAMFWPNDDGAITAYHAATFTVGDTPLPDGAMLPPGDGGASPGEPMDQGAARTGGRSGNAGAGGGQSGSGAAGGSSVSEAEGGGRDEAGGAGGAEDGESANDEEPAPSRASGCSIGATPSHSSFGILMFIALLSFARRLRRLGARPIRRLNA